MQHNIETLLLKTPLTLNARYGETNQTNFPDWLTYTVPRCYVACWERLNNGPTQCLIEHQLVASDVLTDAVVACYEGDQALSD